MPTDTLVDIIRQIKEHDQANPSHGVGCACHDVHAATLRRLFTSEGLIENHEGYRVITKSLRNLLVVVSYVQNNP